MKKTTLTRSGEAGMTLTEALAALSIGMLVLAGLVHVSRFMTRSFPSISEHIGLSAQNSQVLDQMTQDIRQADLLSSCSTNTLVFRMRDLNTGTQVNVSYVFDPKSLCLTRTSGNKTQVLVKGCAMAQFRLFQRNPVPANGAELVSFPAHPSMANRFDLVKAVDITWARPHSLLASGNNTEDVQSARVVIRKG